MYRKYQAFLIAALLSLISQNVRAEQPAWLPAWKSGTHAYVLKTPGQIPDRFTTGKGLAEINAAALKLNTPFYAFVTYELPVKAANAGANPQKAAEDNASASIKAIAEAWNNASVPGLSKSCLTLISFVQPRQFRVVCGSDIERDSRLQLNGPGLQRFLTHFKAKASGATPDFPGAITSYMSAVDEFIFDQTDPVRIEARNVAAAQIAQEQADAERARAEEARRQDMEERLASHRNRLRAAMNTLEATLASHPSETNPSVKDLLAQARVVISRADVGAMEVVKGHLENANRMALDNIEKRADRIRAFAIGSLLALLIAIALIFRHISRQRLTASLQATLAKKIAGIKQLVSEGLGRYTNFYAQSDEVRTILMLKKASKETMARVQGATKEIDEIYVALKALESHAARIERTAATASDPAAVERLISSLDAEFSYDTGELADTLFGPETKHVTIDPTQLVRDLETTYATAQKSWSNITKAIEAAKQNPRLAFPADTYHELVKLAAARGLPPLYLDPHPLAQGADSYYSMLDDLRHSDPFGYAEMIAKCKSAEAQVAARIKEVAEIVNELNGASLPKPAASTAMLVGEKDDPGSAWERAEEYSKEFFAALDRGADTKALKQSAQEAIKAYQTVRSRTEAIALAPSQLSAAKRHITDLRKNVLERQAHVAARVEAMKNAHANVAQQNLAIVGSALVQATLAEEEAAHFESNRYLINAIRSLAIVQEQLARAASNLNLQDGVCNGLERSKQEYETRLAGHSARLSGARARLAQYGGTTALVAYTPPPSNGLPDYEALLKSLDSVEKSWEAAITAARETQARLKREEEERRRRAEEARLEQERLRREEEERFENERRIAEQARLRAIRAEHERLENEARLRQANEERAAREAAEREAAVLRATQTAVFISLPTVTREEPRSYSASSYRAPDPTPASQSDDSGKSDSSSQSDTGTSFGGGDPPSDTGCSF